MSDFIPLQPNTNDSNTNSTSPNQMYPVPRSDSTTPTSTSPLTHQNYQPFNQEPTGRTAYDLIHEFIHKYKLFNKKDNSWLIILFSIVFVVIFITGHMKSLMDIALYGIFVLFILVISFFTSKPIK